VTENRYSQDLFDGVRPLIVAGIPVGVIVAGVGSRLAMLLLRLTSPASVGGVRSDDGFVIGQVTLAGTYNCRCSAPASASSGAGAYQWVRPWLLGPWWFRRSAPSPSSTTWRRSPS
jgi:hypothetical protein